MSTQRVMLVPNPVEGPLDAFYHFLLGYLLPVALWVRRHPGVPVSLMHLGPMTPWYGILAPTTDVQVMSSALMLTRYVRRLQPRVVLRALDNPITFDRGELGRMRDVVREWNGADEAPAGGLLVIDRGAPDPYYRTSRASVMTSGSERRSVPNMGDVARSVGQLGPTRLFDAAQLSPLDQVRTFSSAHTLIAQHGAGLSNMIWMPQGSTVVEILPPLDRESTRLFARLAWELGHGYACLAQEDAHAAVSPESVLAALHEAAPPVTSRGDRLRQAALRRGKLAEDRLRRVPAIGSAVRAVRG